MSPTRTHIYLSAIAAGTHEHFLFEATAIAAAPFQDWFDATGTLRGCLFLASRPKRRKNAKVEIICKAFDISKINLPQPPDIPKAMAVIWQLPGAAISAKPDLSGLEMLETEPRILSAQRCNELHDPAAPKPNGRPRQLCSE
jgi:hypothetical protein